MEREGKFTYQQVTTEIDKVKYYLKLIFSWGTNYPTSAVSILLF
jgi:hypothetical protein